MPQDTYVAISGSLPPGGTTGQVLTKRTNSDGDADWEAGGGGSGITQLTGDVTAGPGSGSQAAAVALVGGSSAANVNAATVLANAATSANTASTVVRRDGSGNFVAGTITASLTGHASLDVPLTRTVSTTSPLTGGGALSSDLTIAIPQADGSTDGFLDSTDWTTFNNKISAIPVNRMGYVDVINGNDGTGVIGDLTKPFATISAAETAVTTATDTNLFNLILAPGVYDVLGLVKKPNINWLSPTNTWLRDNVVKVYTSDASTLDLASLGVTGVESKVVFQNIGFECGLACDLYTLDPVSANHSTWTFINTSTFAPFLFVGRGADHDQIVSVNANYDDGFDFTSVTHRGAGIYTAGGTSLRANNGRGCQWLTSGSQVLAALLIQDVDNASNVIFGGIGSLVGGGITVDGTNAQAFLDASISINGLVIKTNGGTVSLLDRAKFVDCTDPFKDTSGVDSVDVNGRILKDTSGNDSLNWEDRTLRNTDTDVAVDWSDADQKVKFPGSVQLTSAGGGVDIKEGSNARMGVATLVGGTITVSNTSVTANSRIFITVQNPAGTLGSVVVDNITASTSFDIVSTSVLDTSVVAWLIIEAL